MWIIIAAAVIAAGIVSMLIVTMPIASREYTRMFVRDTPEKWGRENSCPEHEEHSVMFEAGLQWGREHRDVCEEVMTEHDGLKLFGEYYDFGGDRCAIILPGRAESLLYSYYFAPCYEKIGYNVLVIDQRAHGLSEGIYSTVGIKEQGDVLAWMKYIRQEKAIEKFVIHGICIGSAAAVFLAAQKTQGLEAIVLEGPFISFHNVLIQRTKKEKKPVFPFVLEIAYYFRKRAGVNIWKNKPVRYIRDVQIPTLFLNGKKDYSSLPQHTEKLYRLCGAQKKQIIWFSEGEHSHLRIRNIEAYDQAVQEFLCSK